MVSASSAGGKGESTNGNRSHARASRDKPIGWNPWNENAGALTHSQTVERSEITPPQAVPAGTMSERLQLALANLVDEAPKTTKSKIPSITSTELRFVSPGKVYYLKAPRHDADPVRGRLFIESGDTVSIISQEDDWVETHDGWLPLTSRDGSQLFEDASWKLKSPQFISVFATKLRCVSSGKVFYVKAPRYDADESHSHLYVENGDIVGFISRKNNFLETSSGWLPLVDRVGTQLFEEVTPSQTTSSLRHQPSMPAATAATQLPNMEESAVWVCSSEGEFVQEMRRQGHLNWILHNGSAFDLSNEGAAAKLSPETLAKLLVLASDSGFLGIPSQSSAPVVPLQPWEATKLMAAAEQVLAALSSGRYCQDFGEMLLGHFQAWQGADTWAQAEVAYLAELVKVDDKQSREALERHIEGSLVVTLREVLKEVHRGQLAGLDCAGNPPSDLQCKKRDLVEEAALQEALLASTCDDQDSELGSDFEVVDLEEHEEANAETLELPHSPSVDADEPVLSHSCDHVCDLNGGSCCCCSKRAPRLGLLPGLRLWWQKRDVPGAFASANSWRFFCQSCATRHMESKGVSLDSPEQPNLAHVHKVLPLPFGGIVELSTSGGETEFVEISSISGQSSWAILSPRSVPSTSDDSSYVLPP